jgi:hypothetical protein
LVLLVSGTACSKCGVSQTAPTVTGAQVTVNNAKGAPVLSRVSVWQKQEEGQYPRKVTETWVQAVTTGTVIPLAPGAYTLRAQGTGDSFIEAQTEVKDGELRPVRLGFATLFLNGAELPEQGRVRVWQKREGGEKIIVTQLVRPGRTEAVVLAAGEYRIGFLMAGLTDEDANFAPLGGELRLSPGEERTVTVAP